MPRYLPENNKTGDFNPQRTLSGAFFVIPERLASTRVVVLAFTANKQTNNSIIFIVCCHGNGEKMKGLNCDIYCI